MTEAPPAPKPRPKTNWVGLILVVGLLALVFALWAMGGGWGRVSTMTTATAVARTAVVLTVTPKG